MHRDVRLKLGIRAAAGLSDDNISAALALVEEDEPGGGLHDRSMITKTFFPA
jgi:hypothetical protein